MLPASSDSGNISSFGRKFLDGHARYRTGWLGGNVCMYVLYVDGSAFGSRINCTSAVAGAAFRADAFVVFENYLADEDIERTVLVHEAGHLLGLEHDDDRGCAMVAMLARNLSMLTGRAMPPDDYCDAHRQQLERARHCLICSHS